jgi:hypothetical protein
MRAFIGALATSLAIAAAGCGGGGDGGSDNGHAGGEITLSRTGGLAGISESLTIAPDGAATVTSGFAGEPRTKEVQIGDAELRAVQAELSKADFEALDEGEAAGCADCFVYVLSYGGETAKADDATASPAFRTAIAPLQRILEEHTGSRGNVK